MNQKIYHELVPRGFYTVNEQRFDDKLQALIQSKATGHHPTWNFHDEHFSTYNWQIEPEQSLDFWYTQRCWQIRDKYQHVVLHFSGGSDSHNILTYFYKNNIHIDEILVANPIEYYEKFTVATDSRESCDLHNEWFHVIKPDLNWIAKHMPKTKITIYDYTKDMLEFSVDQDWIIHVGGEHCNPNVVNRINRYNVIDQNLYDSRQVGHVYGVDKPVVFNVDDSWYFAFLDSILSIQSSRKSVFEGNNHVNVENFYWSPDLPELLIKQAHAVKKYFQNNPQFQHLATFKKKKLEDRDLYQDLVRNVIYPYWRKDIFQNKKSRNMFFKDFDRWFFDLATESAKSRWLEGYNYVLNSIDHKWINFDEFGNPSGMMGFWSKWHKLG